MPRALRRGRFRVPRMLEQARRAGSHPYATGGGGVSLEHTFGAWALSSLLLGDPFPGLGDDQSVVRVRLQAGQSSAIDDVVLFGEPPESGGQGRRISIGVRRNPKIAASDTDFVALLANFLRVFRENLADVEAGQWRLGLAVAGPHRGAAETATLCDLARAHATEATFREVVGRYGTKFVRRLGWLDEAIAAAAKLLEPTRQSAASTAETWRLLKALWILETRLEGDAAADRTNTIARLRTIAADDGAGLFTELSTLARTYAPKGGDVDAAVLRRDLVGKVEIGRSPSHRKGWESLDGLDRFLQSRVRRDLADASGVRLDLGRPQEKQRLLSFLRDVGSSRSLALVTGDPDVGKSTLVAAAIEGLRAERGAVLHVSLLDIPDSIPAFEVRLGTTLSNVLAGAAVAGCRLLVVDGAEAILHGRERICAYLASAAIRSGLGFTAVARDDAREQVVRLLTDVGARDSGSRIEPREASVPPLSDEDIALVLKTFPQLQRVSIEPRSRWLLGRPGLLAALLQGSVAGTSWEGALSELDVYRAVWDRVRRNEQHPPGAPAPDSREAALLALARKQLAPDAASLVDHSALSSLRSDGFLVGYGTDGAFQEEDQFSHDLIRDLALVRLFIKTSKENLLATHGAPRWALRAARIYCQARLRASKRGPDEERQLLETEFSALARAHGERWSDVPWEACLLLGRGVQDAADSLLRDRGRNLEQVLRLVRQRFMDGGRADLAVVAPLIEFFCENRDRINRLPEKVTTATEFIILGWLSALALRGRADALEPLRARVRDELFDLSSEYFSDFEMECLALLGPDLDERAKAALLGVCKRTPHHLHPCLENSFAPVSLAAHHPDLLLTLALSYYIDLPDPNEPPWKRHRHALDEGIRHHHTGGWGPLANAGYGPFFALLHADPRRGMALANQMLNHAARYRVTESVEDPAKVPGDQLRGIDIEIPGVGTRHYIGDDHVWRWYRGTGVGPAPCISALLAVERWADGALREGVPLWRVVRFLLRDCENLAVPGLIVGIVVRHLDSVTDELDSWLVNPLVWRLEFERSMGDRVPNLVVVPRDDDDVTCSERRIWSFREASVRLVVTSLLAGDSIRLDSLARLADTLEANARGVAGDTRRWNILDRDEPADAEDAPLTVQGWAAALRRKNYTLDEEEDGKRVVKFEVPESIRNAQAPDRVDHERGLEAWRLQSAYYSREIADWSGTLEDDIRVAKDLQSTPLASEPPDGLAAPAAVAATVLDLEVRGVSAPIEDHVKWAATTLIDTARAKLQSELWSASSFFPQGSDRIAARGLASAYLALRSPADAELKTEALRSLLTLLDGPVDEVRRVAAVATFGLWSAPCDRPEAGDCFHRRLLADVSRIATRCEIGPVDETRRLRTIVSVAQPLEENLRAVSTTDLILERLTPSLLVFLGCAASSCCVSRDAQKLRDALSDAYIRVRLRYADEHYRVDDADDQALAEYLLYHQNTDLVPAFVRGLSSNGLALKGFLNDLAIVATNDPARRSVFRGLWPTVMKAALAPVPKPSDPAYEDWARYSTASAIIPRPTRKMNERNIDAVLAAAAEGWPTISELAEHIRGWVDTATGEPECTNALTGFLDTTPLRDQAGPGLSWVFERVIRSFGQFVGRSAVLLEWLDKVRASGQLTQEGSQLVRKIVDGLVAAGDLRAVQVQARAE